MSVEDTVETTSLVLVSVHTIFDTLRGIAMEVIRLTLPKLPLDHSKR
jgi:hypothetical protein